jgi:hypothetical protein
MGRDDGRWFRDGMPWWAWVALALARVAALLPLVVVGLLAWWLAQGGVRELPGLAKRAWHAVQAAADSTIGRAP